MIIRNLGFLGGVQGEPPFVWGTWSAGVHMGGDYDTIAAGPGGTWVAAQTSAVGVAVRTSVDGGATWTTYDLSAGGGDNVNRVKYVGGYFFCMTHRAGYRYSIDGIIWTKQTTVRGNDEWEDVHFDGLNYYYAQRSGSSTMSTTGTTVGGPLVAVGTGVNGQSVLAMGGVGINNLVVVCDSQDFAQPMLRSIDGGLNWIIGVNPSFNRDLGQVKLVIDDVGRIRVGGTNDPSQFTKNVAFYTDDQGATITQPDTPALAGGTGVGGLDTIGRSAFGAGTWCVNPTTQGAFPPHITTGIEGQPLFDPRAIPFSFQPRPADDCAYMEDTREFGFVAGSEFMKTTGN